VPSATKRPSALAGAGAEIDHVVGAAIVSSSCSTHTKVLPLGPHDPRCQQGNIVARCRPSSAHRGRSIRPADWSQLRGQPDPLSLATRYVGAARLSCR